MAPKKKTAKLQVKADNDERPSGHAEAGANAGKRQASGASQPLDDSARTSAASVGTCAIKGTKHPEAKSTNSTGAEDPKGTQYFTADFRIGSNVAFVKPGSNALRTLASNQLITLGSQGRLTIGKMVARTSMLDQALQYTNINGYRHINILKGTLLTRRDRYIERALVQRDANLALQREDCREANFADYVHYDLDDYADQLPTTFRQSSGEVRIEMTTITKKSPATTPAKRGVVEELVSHGVSPSEVARLSDIFEQPSSLRNVNMSLIPWIRSQTKKGYWRNEASLFILCVTMAVSIGNVETMFKLNATWNGMVFLIPYMFAYLLVVQPMISFELTTGQLFRGGQSSIYDRLSPGCSGVGTAIVILCLISGCIACSRSSAEYIVYMVDVFKRRIPWKLTDSDMEMCATLKGWDACNSKGPICHYAEGECMASAIGKAYVAHQAKFDRQVQGSSAVDPQLMWAMVATYVIVGVFQLSGIGKFTFSASLLIIIVVFLTHMQVVTTMTLEGATDFLWSSLLNWNWSALYRSSRIWSHSIRSCLYEFIVGSGIYSTLASRSRIGYDLSKEAVGIGMVSGYMTLLLFSTACALIGYYSKILKTLPLDIMWMLEQDCNYILLPLGFQATETMERTLYVLQFGCCVILMCATLAIQIEVAVTNLKDVTLFGINKIARTCISFAMVLLLLVASLFLTGRNGKLVVWFLEIAVGDLGRIFTVLMSSIVVGWLYGSASQKEEMGAKCMYTFNTIFWSFNFIASVCEICDETIPAIVWWVTRVMGIVLATVAAIIINKKDAKHAKPVKRSLWYLFCGNIEMLRAEFCRITPMCNSAELPMTVFWSICIKWFIPCMLSSTISDILEEIVAANRVEVNISNIPEGWMWITLTIWAVMILVVAAPIVLRHCAPTWVPTYNAIDIRLLPSCPEKYSIWANLMPRIIFREFYKNKKDE